MTNEQEQQLSKLIKEKMQDVNRAGLATGIRTIAAIILEKAKADDKSETEKLEDIVSYCKWSLGVVERKEK